MRKSVCGLPVKPGSPGAIGVSRRGGTTSMPPRGPHEGQKRTPTSRPATRSSSAVAVAATERQQFLDVVTAHEEVDVLRLAAEQLVAQRAPDLVQLAERQLRHAAPQFFGIGYSTVTVFARLRGWSIGRPRRRAMR